MFMVVPVVFFFAKLSVCNQAASEIVQKAKKKSIKTEKFFVHQERGLVQKVLSINVALC